MRAVTLVSAALAFLLELGMLFVSAQAGRMFASSSLVRTGFGIVACAGVIALWMMFASPRSERRLAMPQLQYFKGAICGLAAVVLGSTHQFRFGIVFVALSVVSLTLEYRAA